MGSLLWQSVTVSQRLPGFPHTQRRPPSENSPERNENESTCATPQKHSSAQAPVGGCPNAENMTAMVNSGAQMLRTLVNHWPKWWTLWGWGNPLGELSACALPSTTHAMLWTGITELHKLQMPDHRRTEGREGLAAVMFYRTRKQGQALSRLWKATFQHFCKSGPVPCLQALQALRHRSWCQNCW